VFKFRCSSSQVSNYLPGVKWFGRYMMLSPRDEETLKNVWRPYSFVLCLHDARIRIRESVLANFLALLKGAPALPIEREYAPSPMLSVIVKAYPEGKISHLLHNHSGKFYKIKGPYGRGLSMQAGLDGRVLLVAGGTGILPLLDLLDYLLMKAVHEVTLLKAGAVQADRLNVFG
jgi:hypothetical protein